MPRRLIQLFAGLVLYGISDSMLLLAGLGVDPWDVLHQGLAAVMVSAVVLNGVATGLYIGAGLGPGPRDGLMTGFAARGHSLRVVRTGIEATVLLAGWLLGGTVGIGTVVYAACIGPLAHVFVPLFSRSGAPATTAAPRSARAAWPRRPR
jgi:uncharacterized membrane protein YczE